MELWRLNQNSSPFFSSCRTMYFIPCILCLFRDVDVQLLYFLKVILGMFGSPFFVIFANRSSFCLHDRPCSSPDSDPSCDILNLANLANSIPQNVAVMHLQILNLYEGLVRLLVESCPIFYSVCLLCDVDIQLSRLLLITGYRSCCLYDFAILVF